MMTIRYLLLLFAAALLAGNMFAQPVVGGQTTSPDDTWQRSTLMLPNNPWVRHLIDRADIRLAKQLEHPFHTAIRPYTTAHLTALRDPMLDLTPRDRFNLMVLEGSYYFGTASRQPVLKHFYRNPNYLYSQNQPRFQFGINPILHFEGGPEQDVDGIRYINTRGAEVRGVIGKRVGFYSRITENQAAYPQYVMDTRSANRNILPGEGRTKDFKEHGMDMMTAQGYITVDPIPEISVQFGQDKLFLGNGHRSLLLSDASKDYAFLRLNTRVWKINYQNVFADLVDSENHFLADQRMLRKYLTAHFLSVDITPNLNIGLFEAVVRGKTDSLDPRFEWYYLNPVIFYRATEYALGSPDNVLVGLTWRYNFLQRFSFYGQVMLDEFKWDELVNRTGWWANKLGVQAGLKYVDVLGIENLDLQVEYNVVRPYSYTHYTLHGSYSHYRQPLAHPLGANFRENIAIVRYQPLNRLYIEALFMLARYGDDANGTNWGKNILLDNGSIMQQYDNVIGQGVDTRLHYLRTQASWMLKPNIFFDLVLLARYRGGDIVPAPEITTYIGAAFRMNFEGRRFEF